MKKKILMGMLLGSMMFLFAGCGSAEKKEAVKEIVENVETVSVKEDAETTVDAEENTEEVKEETKSTKSGIVLGGSDVEGYEGFEYLYEELLMTETEENEETGKKERKNLIVYIPDDDYASANGDSAYANSMGIEFRVELEPYIRYNAEDYLPEENLDEYVASKYDPFFSTECKDLVITEATKAGDGYVSTVEYCSYNDWDKTYYAEFCTYYLVELETGETVLVSVVVNSEDVTGKTPGLIEELESFYCFEINWDKDRAEQKCTAYAENPTENKFSTGRLLFDLPEGWEKDRNISTADEYIYAPDGDASFSGCMVGVRDEYLGYGEEINLEALVEEEGKEALKEMLGENVSNYTVEMCETGLGEAAKITCSVEEDGYEVKIVMYMIVDDYNLYRIMAMDTADETVSALPVLEDIIANAMLRD